MSEGSIDRLSRLTGDPFTRVSLTRVVVPAHDRVNPKSGRKEHVDTYTYEREGGAHPIGPLNLKEPKAGVYHDPKKYTETTTVSRKVTHKGPAGPVLDEDTKVKIVREGYKLDAAGRQDLMDGAGLTLHNPHLAPGEMYDRWQKSSDPQERADLESDLVATSQMSALYLSMIGQAHTAAKVEHVKAKVEQVAKSKWDEKIASFGKPGQALLKVRDAILNRALSTKGYEAAKKAHEKGKDYVKDVGWRVAEGLLTSSMVSGVVAAAGAILGSGLGEHLHSIIENPGGEAAMGAAVSIGMGLAIRIAKKTGKKVVEKHKAKRRQELGLPDPTTEETQMSAADRLNDKLSPKSDALVKLAAAYSQDKRESLQSKGHAFKNSNGEASYPIPDVEHLKAAIKAFGRAKEEDKPRLKAFIKKRAKALGHPELIPDSWSSDSVSTSASGADAVELTRVVVPAHDRRSRTGKTEHVDTYTYERRGIGGLLPSRSKLISDYKAGKIKSFVRDDYEVPDIDSPDYEESLGRALEHHVRAHGSGFVPPRSKLISDYKAGKIKGFVGDDYMVPDPDSPDYEESLGKALEYHVLTYGYDKYASTTRKKQSLAAKIRGVFRSHPQLPGPRPLSSPGPNGKKTREQWQRDFGTVIGRAALSDETTSALDGLALKLSVDTARVSTVHSPLGKPGGPGLFKTKGLQLPAYIQNIAKALMRDHGFTESHAIATAVNQCKKWAAGGKDVSPEVRAAAAKAVAEWTAAKAKARATK